MSDIAEDLNGDGQHDHGAEPDQGGKYRPAVATSATGTGTTAGSGNRATGSGNRDDTATKTASLEASLKASKRSAAVKNLLNQIAELETELHPTSVQSKMLATLRRAVRNQDRADAEQENLMALRQDILNAERASVRGEAMALVDQVAGAQDIGLSEALDKIRTACAGLLR